MGYLTREDSTLFRGFFKEMAHLRGIPVKYRYPVSPKTTIYSESRPYLSDYIDMDIIFNENPSMNTLKSLRWVSENPDDKPIVAQLPYDAPGISVDCIITIPPIDSVGRARDFKITSITTLLEFPDCWTCTLAPVFDTDFVDRDYDQSNYNFIESPETPYTESPNNRHGNYSYINDGEDSSLINDLSIGVKDHEDRDSARGKKCERNRSDEAVL